MTTAAAAPKNLAAPTPGIRPRMEGVPGVLMESAPAGVLFGRKSSKLSPYDPLLLQLKAAGTGKFLRFADLRARASVSGRAKKLGIKVMFGEHGNYLWVKLAQAEVHLNGHTEPQPEKPSNADLVLRAISVGRVTVGEIVTWMRSNGVPGIGMIQIDGLLGNLARSGKIKLRKQTPGADNPERWMLA